ncbi:MAG: sulfatase-like hydrolase/transferase [Bacteroidetes bacterium]|nr:sulfatase-like hydrolase/transferase [Bacteroidota bacterium]
MQLLRTLGKYPFHSIAIILFFITHGYSENAGAIPIADMFSFFLICAVITIVLLFLIKKWMKSWINAAIIVTILLIFYLFFGAIQESLKSLKPLHWLARYSVMLPGTIVLIIFLAIYLKKKGREFTRATAYLNVLLIILILVDITNISAGIFRTKPNLQDGKNGLLSSMPPCDTCKKPDIYLIVLDEYWGTDMLRKYFNYDNTAFISFLSENGFHVLAHPHSNYTVSPISVGSTFDMKYASHWTNVVVEDYGVIASKIISQSPTIGFLKSSGYEINNCSIFDVENKPGVSDFEMLPIKMRLITSKTLLAKMEKDLFWHVQLKIAARFNWLTKRLQGHAREGNKKIIDRTIEAINKKSIHPQFTYTHLLMPHLPYLYDSLGRDLFLNYYKTGLSGIKNDENYLQYLVYTNKIIMEMIAQIMKRSNRGAVVMLISDHGYRHFSDTSGNFSRYNNLNAIYFPSGNYKAFYDSMSNVNLFRATFNSLFSQKLPMLKDSVVY